MAILHVTWPKFIVNDRPALSLAALLLAIPMSSSGKSIFVGLSLIVILLSGERRLQLKEILVQNWCKAMIMLVLFAVMACLWSPASTHDKLFVLEKYSKLLYLPIFLVGFQNQKARYLGVHAFLIAMAITACLSLIYADHVFRNHIMTSMMMAFAAIWLVIYLFRVNSLYDGFMVV